MAARTQIIGILSGRHPNNRAENSHVLDLITTRTHATAGLFIGSSIARRISRVLSAISQAVAIFPNVTPLRLCCFSRSSNLREILDHSHSIVPGGLLVTS